MVARYKEPIMPTEHRIPATPETIRWGAFDASFQPVLEVESGDLVVLECVSGAPDGMPDASTGMVVPPALAAIHAAKPPGLELRLYLGMFRDHYTGHFARVERTAEGRSLLLRGRDPRKDQSYFLFSLRQHQLARVLFPLGEKTKSDTRDVARECGLRTADKEESMEICFVPDNNYGRFLEQSKLVERHSGEIMDTQGRVLGHHDGIEFYTIGQRKGLGISSAHPLYVIELDPANNRVIVGDESQLNRSEFTVDHCNWIPWDQPPESFECVAKIRYNHPGAAATVRPGPQETATVRLHAPARAVTPGQACVFYDGDQVIGGGWIQRERSHS
jgi:tRNA-specific 2-thiouridylase